MIPRSSALWAACLACVLMALSSHAAQNPSQTTSHPLAQAPLDKAGEAVTETAHKAADAASDAAQRVADVAQTQFHRDPIFWTYVVTSIVSIICLLAFDIARPGSLERAGKRSLASVPAYVWFACALMCYIASFLSQAGALSLNLGLTATSTDPRNMALLSLFGYGGGVLTALILARLLSIAEPGAGLVVDQRSFVQGPLATLLVFPIVSITGLLAAILHQELGGKVQQIGHETLRILHSDSDSLWAWLLAACAIILAPIFEELVFRGMLQSTFVRALGRPWLAIFLTSALFAANHLVGSLAMPWYNVLAIFVFSVGLGVALERTKRIAVPIIMHVLFNAANVAITMLIS